MLQIGEERRGDGQKYGKATGAFNLKFPWKSALARGKAGGAGQRHLCRCLALSAALERRIRPRLSAGPM
jgi:hypothetical protein